MITIMHDNYEECWEMEQSKLLIDNYQNIPLKVNEISL